MASSLFRGFISHFGIVFQKNTIPRREFLRLSNRSEQLHFFLNGCLDCFKAGSKKLTGIKALTLQILTGLNILTGSFLECKLALGVYIDLGYAKVNCLLYHICRNSGTTVKNQRKDTSLLLYRIQSLEA